MIAIIKTAEAIKEFLEEKGFEKFRIFIRLNFCLETYVVVPAQCGELDLSKEFFQDKPVVKNVKFKTINEDELEDSVFADLFEGDYPLIEKSTRFRFNALLDKASDEDKTPHNNQRPPIVTFYSYKGGMGRTTAMIAYALDSVINQKKKVVIIDCDLEAPGYLNFFNLSEEYRLKNGQRNGFVEFMSDAQFLGEDALNIDDYIINVGDTNVGTEFPEIMNSLWVMPAGNLNEGYDELELSPNRQAYLEGLSRLNLANTSNIQKNFDILFKKIIDRLHPDVILIDSRTGFNDIFGATALLLSDRVVGFFGYSRQTEPGLANLLTNYYADSSKFGLNIAFSILPVEQTEWEEKNRRRIQNFDKYLSTGCQSTPKDSPTFTTIHRNSLLERIGTGDASIDRGFYNAVKSGNLNEYTQLFESINSIYPPKEEEEEMKEEAPVNKQMSMQNTLDHSHPSINNVNGGRRLRSIELRNIILRNLKKELEKVKNFAEYMEIEEPTFFYRECMKDFFKGDKFIIQGYKGTGKTFLYKALANQEIATKIQRMANIDEDKIQSTKFVNIIPSNDVPFVPIDDIDFERTDIKRYFRTFWRIITWSELIRTLETMPEFSNIRSESTIGDLAIEFSGSRGLEQIEKMINKGTNLLVAIEDDLQMINTKLKENKLNVFLLYDRLDSLINPLYWNRAVSPLVEYWRSFKSQYSNISPKIFIRTDLFRRIEGTNTQSLADFHTLSIEWSIEEVFGYIIKLAISTQQAFDAFWQIAERALPPRQKYHFDIVKRQLEESSIRQFRNLNESTLKPLVHFFFGREVKVGNTNLGSPWDYFSKELANADNNAISLRPFINMLSNSIVDESLQNADAYVRFLLDPNIYASKSVREKTTDDYFNDLTQDEFSKDLRVLKDLIRSEDGKRFKFKALTEKEFDDFINTIFSMISERKVVDTTETLKTMIYANGIMSRKPTTNGTFYRFAPIYWYSWGLSNSSYEKIDYSSQRLKGKKQTSNNRTGVFHEPLNGKPYVIDDETHTQYRNIKGSYQDLADGDRVSFSSYSQPDRFDPNSTYIYVFNVKKL